MTHSLEKESLVLIIPKQLGLQPKYGCRPENSEEWLRLCLSEKGGAQRSWLEVGRSWTEVAKELVPVSARYMPQRAVDVLRMPILVYRVQLNVVPSRIRHVAPIQFLVLVKYQSTEDFNISIVNESHLLSREAFCFFVEQNRLKKLLHQLLGFNDLFLERNISSTR